MCNGDLARITYCTKLNYMVLLDVRLRARCEESCCEGVIKRGPGLARPLPNRTFFLSDAFRGFASTRGVRLQIGLPIGRGVGNLGVADGLIPLGLVSRQVPL